jgi:hypothetical protein
MLWGLIPTGLQWRRWSLPGKASYIGAVIAVIGLPLALLPLLVKHDEFHDRLEGSLSSILSGDDALLLQVRTLREFAKTDSQQAPVFIGNEGILQDNTHELQSLQSDGAVFRQLSNAMKRRLPTFIRSRVNIISTLNPKVPDLRQGGSLRLLDILLATEQQCLASELAYQQGKINSAKNDSAIGGFMHHEAEEVAHKQLPDGVELGPLMPMVVPDRPDSKKAQ